MTVNRTIKVKISGSTKVDALLPVWLKCLNWLSKIVYETKEINSNRLHKAYYAKLREMGLPSQVACSATKTASAAYVAQKAKKRWSLAKFATPSIPVVWRHNFKQVRKGVSVLGEVIKIEDTRPLPAGVWKSSKVKLVNGQWYLLLVHELEVPEPKTEGCIVGVDMGVKRMLVATNSRNSETFFYHGGALNHRRSCIRRARAQTQSVGSRSARRLLKRMGTHEAAVTGHLIHDASKALVKYAVRVGARKIVVENLSNVRDNSLKTHKSHRAMVHRWPYYGMRIKIAYKAENVGIALQVVDPKNTSTTCPCCGHVARSNRNGLHFKCKRCLHRGDSDRIGSVNIRLRSVFTEQDFVETGRRRAPNGHGIANIDTKQPAFGGSPVLV